MNAIQSRLPPVNYSVWMLDFQFGCMIFNIISFTLYAVVNFGLQQCALAAPACSDLCYANLKCQQLCKILAVWDTRFILIGARSGAAMFAWC